MPKVMSLERGGEKKIKSVFSSRTLLNLTVSSQVTQVMSQTKCRSFVWLRSAEVCLVCDPFCHVCSVLSPVGPPYTPAWSVSGAFSSLCPFV